MNIRAWSIVRDVVGTYIIVQFNCNNDTIGLASWLHPIDVSFVRAIMPLPVEFEVSAEQVERMEVLLKW